MKLFASFLKDLNNRVGKLEYSNKNHKCLCEKLTECFMCKSLVSKSTCAYVFSYRSFGHGDADYYCENCMDSYQPARAAVYWAGKHAGSRSKEIIVAAKGEKDADSKKD